MIKYSRYSIRYLITLLLLGSLVFLFSGCTKENSENTPIVDDPKQEMPADDSSDSTPDSITGVTELPVLTEPISGSNFLLNTFVSIKLYDRGNQELLQECFTLIQNYEDMLSRTIDTSEISQLNANGGQPLTVSEDTAALLKMALHYSELSEGAFDLTVAPISSLWDFTALEPVLPSETAIKNALPHIGYNKVAMDGNTVTLTDPQAGIDLGAIAKGFIADRVKDHLISRGVESAIINLGGNVLCIGSKPDGSGFNVGIQKPFEGYSETIAILELHDMSVVSSGIYERCFWVDDTFYHHILDPKTGYPVENDLIAVTILSRASADGDGLSTTCFSLGLEKGMALIDSLPDTWAVFITDDYQLHYSEGFEENIKIVE